MSANTAPIYPAIAKTQIPITFVNADATAYKDLVIGLATGNAAGSLVERVAVVSDDTSIVTLKVAIKVGATDYPIGEVAVPVGAGTNGTVRSINLLSLLSAAPDISNILRGDGSLVLPAGAILRVGPKVAVTAAKTVTVVPFSWDY